MKSIGMTDCYRTIDQGVFESRSIVERGKKSNEKEKEKKPTNRCMKKVVD
jgi:hypothetical protein